MAAGAFQVIGNNDAALFTLKIHRGEGMCLLAMNWKPNPATGKDTPPDDFVGFAIEYKEPGGDRFFALKNRLSFAGPAGDIVSGSVPTKLAPIQKFRWVHFPFHADLPGDFMYRVSPVFMNEKDELSYGDPQEAAIELRRETYPGKLNVTFTRGFVSSQAFVDKYGADSIPLLLPAKAEKGLEFVPTHPKADEALTWMGFEARSAILEVLDEAIADKGAQVRAAVYDLNEPGMVTRFKALGDRLKIIIDDDGPHGAANSGETKAAKMLEATAGAANVKRQHLGKLQHNKIIVVDGPKVKATVCGSTNHSWRGFFVQNNNAIVMRGKSAVSIFLTAFNNYWNTKDNKPGDFSSTGSAVWNDVGLPGINAQIGFSPRSTKNAVLKSIADDIANNTTSSLFFSLAFLYQTPGPIRSAVTKIKNDNTIFSYGISDHDVEGLNKKTASGVDIQRPDGKVSLVSPAALAAHIPEPFKSEPSGGGGTRMHHKFIVIDFDKPTARVYMGSYNFSQAADTSNGENLMLIKDRKIAVAYVVEAIRLFDHYDFRVAQMDAKQAKKKLQLAKPPRAANEKPWWAEDYKNARKILDRKLFA